MPASAAPHVARVHLLRDRALPPTLVSEVCGEHATGRLLVRPSPAQIQRQPVATPARLSGPNTWLRPYDAMENLEVERHKILEEQPSWSYRDRDVRVNSRIEPCVTLWSLPVWPPQAQWSRGPTRQS